MKESWKNIVGYKGYYQVSNLGRIFRESSGGISKGYKNKKGYLCISLYKDGNVEGFRVHRLVAEAFIRSPFVGEQINHKDGDKENNIVSNLEWVTCKENIIHAKEVLDVMPRGEEHGQAKLSYRQVAQIVGFLAKGISQRKIAEMFGVAQCTVCDINQGKTWGHSLTYSHAL